MLTDTIDYEVKRLDRVNISDLAVLYHAVYHRHVPSRFFINKYNTAYTGVSHIGFIAYNSAGMPVAFYGVIPCLLQHGAQTVLTAQSADTMTHPVYRNMGLFVKLANLTFDLCKHNGIRVVFGFPNQNSLPGFINKLGWQETDTMDCFVIPIHKFNWEHLFKRLPLINRLYESYISYILKKNRVTQTGLNNSALQDGYDGIDRTASYLSYKTYNSTYVIQTDHALVWLKIKNGLLIGDICLATEDLGSVMRTVTRLARQIGVKQIMFQASPGTKLHGLFSERYWSAPSFPVIFKDMGSKLSLQRIKFTTADIDTF